MRSLFFQKFFHFTFFLLFWNNQWVWWRIILFFETVSCEMISYRVMKNLKLLWECSIFIRFWYFPIGLQNFMRTSLMCDLKTNTKIEFVSAFWGNNLFLSTKSPILNKVHGIFYFIQNWTDLWPITPTPYKIKTLRS